MIWYFLSCFAYLQSYQTNYHPISGIFYYFFELWCILYMHSLEGNNVFMISILEGVAQEESAARSENIKWGILRGV